MSVLILDDTHSDIHYEGSDWTLITTDTDAPYNHTFHETHGAASLSLRFSGTSISLYGAPSDQSTTFTCTIDGKVANGIVPPPEQRIYYWAICSHVAEDTQEHLITLNIAVPEGATFRFDMIAYAPLQDVTKQITATVPGNSSMITYQPDSNWNVTATSYVTHTPGSSLVLKFTGTGAAFYATLQSSSKASTAEYSIDESPATAFTIRSSDHPLQDQLLFSVSGLIPIEHTLIVTYTEQQSDAAPLEFNYFNITLLQDATPDETPPQPSSEIISLAPLVRTGNPSSTSDPLLSLGSISSSPPSPTGSTDSLDEAKMSKSVGAIAGGTIGGVLALTTIVLVIIIFVRRSRRRRLSQFPESDIAPFVTLNRPQLDRRRQEKTMFPFDDEPGVIQHVDTDIRLGGPSGATQDSPPRRKKR